MTNPLSSDEIVREALHLKEERKQIKEEIRQKIEAGWASARAGRLIDGEAFIDQMLAELNEEIRAEDEQDERARVANP